LWQRNWSINASGISWRAGGRGFGCYEKGPTLLFLFAFLPSFLYTFQPPGIMLFKGLTNFIYKGSFRAEASVLLKTGLLYNFSGGLLEPFYAVFVGRVGGSLLDAGIAFAIFNIVTGVLIFTFCRTNFYARHMRYIVTIGYLMDVPGYLAYIFVRNSMELFVVQIFLGLALGLAAPAWDALFSANLSEAQASTHWSAWNGGIAIALGLGGLIGSLIITALSFEALFIIMAAMSGLAGFLSLRIIKSRPT